MHRTAWISLSLVVVACGGKQSPPPTPEPAVAARANAALEPDEPDEPRQLRGPKAEVKPHDLDITLPAVPSFDLLASDPGFHGPKELLVQGTALLGTQIRVKGYITWIYDCIADVRKPGLTDRQVKMIIEDDPTRCERPKLYLGDSPSTPPRASIWVVDVPRKPNKLEQERLPREELARWPKVPRIKVGDFVAITGTWSIQSPHSEVNSEGLLVYADLMPAVARPGARAMVPTPSSTVQPATQAAPATRAKVKRADRDASVEHLASCVKSLGRKQYETASVDCEAATTIWPDNAPAWYALGAAQAGLREWRDAAAAFERAVAIEPTEPMYHQNHGIALYNAGIADAREAQAIREGRKPDEVIPDLSAVDFDPAHSRLLLAVTLQPLLWNAHYHIGRIHRTRDRARDAAEAFGRAITTNPFEADPFVALAELYRRWGYLDEAIAIAGLGTQHIPGGREAANAWYVLGMSYQDKGLDDQALEAFDQVTTVSRDHAAARFQRAQIHLRKGDHAKAKRDLEEFLAMSPNRSALERTQANRMLLQIEAKRP